MKRARQAEILNIIQAVDVETQEQLLDELKARGFSATQATISRDIKELRLVKELSGGGYRYASSERKGLADSDARLRNIFKEGVTSVDRAQNIVVVRTMPGLASAACSALEPCPDWPRRPAPPWTAWRSQAWWAAWPETTRASSSCGTTTRRSASTRRSTSS